MKPNPGLKLNQREMKTQLGCGCCVLARMPAPLVTKVLLSSEVVRRQPADFAEEVRPHLGDDLRHGTHRVYAPANLSA